MSHFEKIELTIPVILVREGEHFIVSCDALSVYAQSADSNIAVDGFINSIKGLFHSLINEKKLEDYLYARSVVTRHFKQISLPEISKPALQLGHYTNWTVPAQAMALA